MSEEPTTYLESEAASRRGELLQILATSNDLGCNAGLLQEMIRMRGYRAAYDLVLDDLAWLVERQLVTFREIADKRLYRLLQRGRDFVRGDAAVHGVRRPE